MLGIELRKDQKGKKKKSKEEMLNVRLKVVLYKKPN